MSAYVRPENRYEKQQRLLPLGRAGDREPGGYREPGGVVGGFGWIGVPVKRHRGEPGHTRDTRDTRADKKTPGGAGTHTYRYNDETLLYFVAASSLCVCM